MKYIRIIFCSKSLVFFLLYGTTGLAQFGGEENIVTDYSFSTDGPTDIKTIDIDDDGDLDVVMTSFLDGKIAWYENQGGVFGTQNVIDMEVGEAWSIDVGDIDNDGLADLVVVTLDTNLLLWYKHLDGQGTFDEGVVISSEIAGGRDVVIADINGDTNLDILTASINDDTIRWFSNDGNGGFSNPIIIDSGLDGPRELAIADIDGDLDLDVIAALGYDNKVVWYKNEDGEGTFGGQIQAGGTVTGCFSVFAGDIDSDGDVDLTVSSYSGNSILWLENLDGLGNFSNTNLIDNIVHSPEDVHMADLDGDTDLDIFVAESASGGGGSTSLDPNAWYENIDGLGDFQKVGDVIPSYNLTQRVIISGDIDNDGDEDILAGGGGRFYWHENIDNTNDFSNKIYITKSVVVPKKTKTGDIDGDGDDDIVVTEEYDNVLHWFENMDGDGSFGYPQVISSVNGVEHFSLADIDGDLDLDIVTQNFKNGLVWFKNEDGNGLFSEAIEVTTEGRFFTDLITTDIDGDGDQDIVDLSRFPDHTIAWTENLDGLGTFGTRTVFSTNNHELLRSVKAGDLDGDLDVDLAVVAENGGFVAWYENTDGAGTFGPVQPLFSSLSNAKSVSLSDIDNDSDLDILVSTFNGDPKVGWFENVDGQGTFSDVQVVYDDDFIWGIDMSIGDVNDDGFDDVVIADTLNDEVFWVENLNGTGEFGGKQIVRDNIAKPSAISFGNINGDSRLDIVSSTIDDTIVWLENGGSLSVDDNLLMKVALIPNPTSGPINIFLSEGMKFESAIIYSVDGKKVMTISDTNFNLATVPKGIYYVKVYSNLGVKIGKIVKQ